jgi:hypothetical protein
MSESLRAQLFLNPVGPPGAAPVYRLIISEPSALYRYSTQRDKFLIAMFLAIGKAVWPPSCSKIISPSHSGLLVWRHDRQSASAWAFRSLLLLQTSCMSETPSRKPHGKLLRRGDRMAAGKDGSPCRSHFQSRCCTPSNSCLTSASESKERFRKA